MARVAAGALKEDWHCESITRGGADLVELWGDFEARLSGGTSGTREEDHGDSNGQEERWDVVVLQVGSGSAQENAHFDTTEEVLKHRYGPLLSERQPGCLVLLYQTWAEPRDPAISHGEPRARSIEAYRAALAARLPVRVAWAGKAFSLLREGAAERLGVAVDGSLYPALFKDDSGHPSPLAGVLVAAIVVLSLRSSEDDEEDAALGRTASRMAAAVPATLGQGLLSQVLASILPQSWRTASSGYAAEAAFGQRLWLEGKRTLPPGLLDEAAEEESSSVAARYPAGLRTEKRSLGPAPCDALVAAAIAVSAGECRIDDVLDCSTPAAEGCRGQPHSSTSRRWRPR